MSISSLLQTKATAQGARQGVAAGNFIVRKTHKKDCVLVTDNTVGSSATARLIRETQE
jgi:hypothetical protein